MGKLRLFAATGGLTAVVALTGCTSGEDDTTPALHSSASSSSSSPTAPSASDRAEHVPGETVTKAPVLPDGKAVSKVANAHGNRELEIPGGIKAGALSILVNCQGQGTLTVSVKPVGLSFPLECVTGEVSSTYNQLDLKNSRENGIVTVTAPSRVRWALTVGQ